MDAQLAFIHKFLIPLIIRYKDIFEMDETKKIINGDYYEIDPVSRQYSKHTGIKINCGSVPTHTNNKIQTSSPRDPISLHPKKEEQRPNPMASSNVRPQPLISYSVTKKFNTADPQPQSQNSNSGVYVHRVLYGHNNYRDSNEMTSSNPSLTFRGRASDSVVNQQQQQRQEPSITINQSAYSNSNNSKDLTIPSLNLTNIGNQLSNRHSTVSQPQNPLKTGHEELHEHQQYPTNGLQHLAASNNNGNNNYLGNGIQNRRGISVKKSLVVNPLASNEANLSKALQEQFGKFQRQKMYENYQNLLMEDHHLQSRLVSQASEHQDQAYDYKDNKNNRYYEEEQEHEYQNQQQQDYEQEEEEYEQQEEDYYQEQEDDDILEEQYDEDEYDHQFYHESQYAVPAYNYSANKKETITGPYKQFYTERPMIERNSSQHGLHNQQSKSVEKLRRIPSSHSMALHNRKPILPRSSDSKQSHYQNNYYKRQQQQQPQASKNRTARHQQYEEQPMLYNQGHNSRYNYNYDSSNTHKSPPYAYTYTQDNPTHPLKRKNSKNKKNNSNRGTKNHKMQMNSRAKKLPTNNYGNYDQLMSPVQNYRISPRDHSYQHLQQQEEEYQYYQEQQQQKPKPKKKLPKIQSCKKTNKKPQDKRQKQIVQSIKALNEKIISMEATMQQKTQQINRSIYNLIQSQEESLSKIIHQYSSDLPEHVHSCSSISSPSKIPSKSETNNKEGKGNKKLVMDIGIQLIKKLALQSKKKSRFNACPLLTIFLLVLAVGLVLIILTKDRSQMCMIQN